MASTREEYLTGQFYEWEKCGRGWTVFDMLVELEPHFEPFIRNATSGEVLEDDGKQPSLFASLFNLFDFSSTKDQAEEIPAKEMYAVPFQHVGVSLQCISVSLPKGIKVKAKETEQLLVMLSFCTCPLSFEIIATKESIRLQFICREPDVTYLESQLKAFFPECIIQNGKHTPFDLINEKAPVCALELGLRDEFMRPVAMADNFDLDPFTGLFGIMERLNTGDKIALQILFQGVTHPWASSIMHAVTDNKGGSFFMDAPEMVKLAEQKVSSPLYAVVIRAIGESTNYERAEYLAVATANALMQASHSEGNVIGALNGYSQELLQLNILLRQTNRAGMILNSRELATFVHFPSPSIATSKLERDTRKTKGLPAIAENQPFQLGLNIHQGKETIVSVNAAQRLKHTHIIGATGTGKSTFLLSLIAQDIAQGQGVAVLDPHGDLIENILAHIPENRHNDVILIDPADAAFPVGFNILSAHSEIEKEILSSDLVSVFRRLSTSWGDQMNSVFANAILAFLESNTGGTLMDLRRFLVEKPFRDTYLKTVTDPHIVYYWQKEFPLLKTSSIGSILTRLDTFLRPKAIRNMVAQKRGLDFEQILDTKKILLVKLSQGLIGDENSYLLGTLFVSKIYQAAMARQAKSKDLRSDFFLYVDEFQNFITPSMSAILSGARKYHLGLILAHQDMQQLAKQDTELAGAVTSNAGTRVCFRLGDTDAKRFESGFSFFDAHDLQNLNTGEAIVRIDRPEYDFTLTITPTEQPDISIAEERQENIIRLSRNKYATPRESVEAALQYSIHETLEPEVIPVAPEKTEPIQQKETAKQEQPVIEVPSLTELQKEETTKNLVKQKELSQHRYLQGLIKKMAEARGYKATIEEPTPDGQGRVDVLLERNGKRIACEIGVTTTKEWEVHNIEKCITAGCDVIVAVPIDKRAADVMQKKLAEKFNDIPRHVFVMEADALFHYLDSEVAKEASSETRIKGYRVKVEYDAISAEAMKQKRGSVTKVMMEEMKRKDGK